MRFKEIAPPEVKRNVARTVIWGREEVLIEQHTGLFSYETKCIRVRTRTGLMTVTGENLIISHFGAQDLLIQGKIDAVDWGSAAT